MSSSSTNVDEEVLVDRMNAIRNVSERHVAALHREAQRLVDWREHVRSAPIIAVTAASVVGYLAVSSVVGNKPSRTTVNTAAQSDGDALSQTAKTSIGAGVMAFVGSLASLAVKQYATNYIRNSLKG